MKKIVTLLALAFCLNGWAQCAITITGNTVVCNGDATTLTANGASSYTWSTGVSTPTISILANNYTTYTVTGTTGTCTATQTVAILGNATPTLGLFVSSSNICAGSSAIIYPSGATTYTLFPGSLTGTSFTVTPNSPTSYTINGTDGLTGCSNDPANAAIASIMVYPSPTVNVSGASINPASCGLQNGGIIPSANVLGGTAPYSYQWYIGNSPVSGATSLNLSNAGSGTYSFQVIDANSCTTSGSFFVIPGTPTPSVTYTLTQDATSHTWDVYASYVSGTPPYTYSWSWGDGTNDNAAYPSHTYSVAGTYSICVTVTDANGCSSTYCQNDAVSRLGNNNAYSSMVYVNVFNGLSSISQYSNLNTNISVYPNPNNGVFNLSISQLENEKTNSIEVYNLIGECVHRQIIASADCLIDLSSLQNGIYNLSIISNEGVVNKSVVISR